jgi:stress response protein YsnF
MSLEPDTTTVSAPLLLHTEDISVARRRVEGDTVRVSTATRTVEKLVEEELVHGRIEVGHVAIGRQIDSVPAVREEGDVTVIPVVEEILVVEKRLILKEEVRIRRVRVPDVHREIVTIRE